MLGKQKKFNIVSDFIASTNTTKLSNIEFLKAKIGIKSLESLDEELLSNVVKLIVKSFM